MRRFSCWILRLMGWKIKGWNPSGPGQYVLIVIPHTSNWDFPLGLLVRSALQLDIKFVAKNTLFKWPFGIILRWMGGYPVDRSATHNYVDTVAEIFTSQPDFKLCIAPEGTRSKVEKLKSGFYFIAKKAGVPIVPVAFDYGVREVRVATPISSDLDYEDVYDIMRAFYKGAVGKNPTLGFVF